MIIGAHSIVNSTAPEADRAFLRDVLRLPHVDVGEGWLIFGLPPAEVAIHPAEEGSDGSHELYLLCEDVEAFLDEMGQRDIEASPVEDRGWGLLTQVVLPGGGKLGVYQPRHARPETPGSAAAPKKKAAKKKAAKKKAAPKATKAAPKAAKGAKPAKKKAAKKVTKKKAGKR